ncbi:MAG: 2-oxoacid:acceptor oxidoreductase subunit alpha [Deltaproteobacteria bacterium]|nr:2-oxoacid:acceptor oxidoreductase subunit alpha [Deltaproteobacteria bacterium]
MVWGKAVAHIIKEDLSVVLAGEAGQGIQTIEAILTRLLKRGGFNIFATKEYMSRVRGGVNSTEIRIASHKVSAFLDRIDILIPLNRESLPHLAYRTGENTLIIGEKDKIGAQGMLDVPFTKIGLELGNAIYANVVAVGMVAGLLGIDRTLCSDYTAEYFARQPEDVRLKNREAVTRGHEIGVNLARETIWIEIKRDPGIAGDIMITGGEAVALGALAGGCNYLCAYPMSPATSVLVNMADYSKRADIIVEQVEDEVGVVNMAIGAWYAGARAMASTSGGGFALMTEGISLAGAIETPLVVHVAQRPGPATGLPTRTEQGDLNLVLYAGHGVFPRIILAPRSIEDAFILSRKAFDLADKHQVPVFILTDQYLMDSYYNTPLFATEELRIGKYVTETKEDYARYRLTENGVSPRGIPGHGSGIVRVDSDEHDEGGFITEDFIETRNRMVEKRLRKFDAIREDIVTPILRGARDYKTLLIGWGSTFHALSEAMDRLDRKDVAMLHFSWLYPLPTGIREYLARAQTIVIIEGNATAQFGDQLKLATGVDIGNRILKYNGMPFSVEELVEKIRPYTVRS